MRENKKNSMKNSIKEVWKKIMVPSLSGAFFAMSHMTMLLSPLLMMGSTLVLRLFLYSDSGLRNLNVVFMSIAMVATTIIVGIVNVFFKTNLIKRP